MKRMKNLTGMVCALLAVLMICYFNMSFAEKRLVTLRDGGNMGEIFEELGYEADVIVSTKSLRHYLKDDHMQIGYDIFGTNSENIKALRDEELLYHLEESETVRKYTAGLLPYLQGIVTSSDGQIVGIPLSCYITEDHIRANPEAFVMAGLAEDEIPGSYTDLLNFLDAWAERLEKEPESEVCVLGSCMWNHNSMDEETQYGTWLMKLLMEIWLSDQYQTKTEVSFKDEKFIALAEQTRTVARRLWKAEPRTKKRLKMTELFTDYVAVEEDAFNYLFADGLRYTMPMRLDETQEPVYLVSAEVLVFPKGGMEQADAVRAAERMIGIDDSEEKAEGMTMFADSGAGTVESMGETYTVTETALKDYQSAKLTTAVFPFVVNEDKEEKALQQFLHNEITATELAEQLDALIFW